MLLLKPTRLGQRQKVWVTLKSVKLDPQLTQRLSVSCSRKNARSCLISCLIRQIFMVLSVSFKQCPTALALLPWGKFTQQLGFASLVPPAICSTSHSNGGAPLHWSQSLHMSETGGDKCWCSFLVQQGGGKLWPRAVILEPAAFRLPSYCFKCLKFVNVLAIGSNFLANFFSSCK